MPSFDIVIETDLQEVDNALNQARKEVGQRYDFRGSKSQIDWDKKAEITLLSDDDYKLTALLDIVQTKMFKRGISPKNLKAEKAQAASDGMSRQKLTLQMGIPKEIGKTITKEVKQAKMKVQASIQEDQVRVTGKKRDDLQAVIDLIKEKDLGYEFQFVNFRD